MSASRSLGSLARYATISTPRPKILVIGAGTGGLTTANQLYNTFKSRGETLADGDITIVDVKPRTMYS